MSIAGVISTLTVALLLHSQPTSAVGIIPPEDDIVEFGTLLDPFQECTIQLVVFKMTGFLEKFDNRGNFQNNRSDYPNYDIDEDIGKFDNRSHNDVFEDIGNETNNSGFVNRSDDQSYHINEDVGKLRRRGDHQNYDMDEDMGKFATLHDAGELNFQMPNGSEEDEIENDNWANISPSFEYDVKLPPGLPVILTVPRYQYTKRDPDHKLYCSSSLTGRNYAAHMYGKEIAFPRNGNIRQRCSVQVFLNPKLCDRHWNLVSEYNFGRFQVLPAFKHLHGHPGGSLYCAEHNGDRKSFPILNQFQIQIVQHSLLSSAKEPKVIAKRGHRTIVDHHIMTLDLNLIIDGVWGRPLNSYLSPEPRQNHITAFTAPTKLLLVLPGDELPNDTGRYYYYVFPNFEVESVLDYHLAQCPSWDLADWKDGYLRFPMFRTFHVDLPITTLEELQSYRFPHNGSTWTLSNASTQNMRYVGGGPYLRQHLDGNFSLQLVLLDSLSPNSSFIYNYGTRAAAMVEGDDPTAMSYVNPLVELVEGMKATSYIFRRNPQNAMHFISCAQIDEHAGNRRIEAFASYDSHTWVLLFIFGGASGMIAAIYAKTSARGRPPNIGNITFGNLKIIMTLLLTQGTGLIHKSRLLCGFWIMVLILLKGVDQGRRIQGFTAPLPPVKLEEFRQLVEHQLAIYSDQIQESRESFIGNLGERVVGWEPLQNIKSAGLPLTSIVTVLDAFLTVDNYKRFGQVMSTQLVQSVVRPRGMKERISMSEEGYYLEQIASRARAAYANVRHKVVAMYHKLVRKGIPEEDISVSKEGFGDAFRNFHFRRLPFPTRIFETRWQSLFHSGIAELWEHWFDRVSTWNITVSAAGAAVHPRRILSSGGSIMFVFYMLLFLLLGCVFVFLLEIRRSIALALQTFVLALDNHKSTISVGARQSRVQQALVYEKINE